MFPTFFLLTQLWHVSKTIEVKLLALLLGAEDPPDGIPEALASGPPWPSPYPGP
jgi:hypothetical protein